MGTGMERAPGFGAMLARLLSHKGLSAGFLARRMGIPESDLQAVLDGAAPDGSLIWRLAPELGLHVADLFVIAAFATVLGIPIGDLAAIGGLECQFSADPADLDGGDMAALIWEARRLTAEQVRRAGEQIPRSGLWGLSDRKSVV